MAHASIPAWYAKYGIDLFPMIHLALISKLGTSTWSEIYDATLSSKREAAIRAAKDAAAREKRTALNGRGDDLLTEENLRNWIEAGESYSSISYKYTGSATAKIAAAVKSFGIEKPATNSYKPLPTDPEITAYVSSTPTEAIIAALYDHCVPASAPAQQQPTPDEPLPLATAFTAETLAALLEEHKTYTAIGSKLGVNPSIIADFCKLYGLKSKYVAPFRRGGRGPAGQKK